MPQLEHVVSYPHARRYAAALPKPGAQSHSNAGDRDAVFTLDEQRALAAYATELLVIRDATHDLMLDPA
ncbi:MAG TPA: hypothetical protein VFX76_20070 [Roseiflexaceae bacterium]|nr:hypothetical protein [Roseiflexaceae bacterium]